MPAHLSWFVVQVSCTEYYAALLRARNLHARDQNWGVTGPMYNATSVNIAVKCTITN